MVLAAQVRIGAMVLLAGNWLLHGRLLYNLRGATATAKIVITLSISAAVVAGIAMKI